jgi:hypothetical protein
MSQVFQAGGDIIVHIPDQFLVHNGRDRPQQPSHAHVSIQLSMGCIYNAGHVILPSMRLAYRPYCHVFEWL